MGLIAADAAIPALRRALETAGIAAGLIAERVGEEAGERVSLVPATLANGLEFDSVVVVEPADIVAAELRGLNRLYVVLTRAVSRLAVVHTQPLLDMLTDT